MQLSCFAVILQFIVLKIVTAQFSITPPYRILQSQINTTPENINQQLINTLLSSTYSEAQFPDRLQILTSALRQMPPKRNRIDLVEQLKQSALQSLTVAANVCKGTGGLPVEYVLNSQTGQLRLAEQGLPGQAALPGQLRQSELISPGLLRVSEQARLPPQLKMTEQGLPAQFRLPDQAGQVALPLPVANFLAKEIFGGGPVDYEPTRTITIRY